MKCPVCDVELKITERQGVEIDYCPNCRGVWLDRGELDKILERTRSDRQGDERERERDDRDDRPRRDDYRPSVDPRYGGNRDWDERRDRDDDYYKRKKRKSFFEDIFDF